MKFGFIAKHRGIWPCGMDVRGARCLAGWLLCVADTTAQPRAAAADEELGAKVRASFLGSDRTYGARRVWHDLLPKVCSAACIGSSD